MVLNRAWAVEHPWRLPEATDDRLKCELEEEYAMPAEEEAEYGRRTSVRTSTRSHCGGKVKTDPYMTESVKTAPRRQTRRSRSRSPRVSRVAEKHRSRKSSRVKEEQSRGRLSSASVKEEKSRSPRVSRAGLPSLPSLGVSASIKGGERPSGEVPLTNKVKQRSTSKGCEATARVAARVGSMAAGNKD